MRKLLLLIIAITFISCKPASRVIADDTMEQIVTGELKAKFLSGIVHIQFSKLLWQQQFYKNNELPPYEDLFTDTFYFPDGIDKYELVEQQEQKVVLIHADEYSRKYYNTYNYGKNTYEEYVEYMTNKCTKDGGKNFPDIQCCFKNQEYELANYIYICHSSVAKYRLTIRMVKEFDQWRCGGMYYFEI